MNYNSTTGIRKQDNKIQYDPTSGLVVAGTDKEPGYNLANHTLRTALMPNYPNLPQVPQPFSDGDSKRSYAIYVEV